eukprot:2893249-Pyramimonas_sp.AAC.1
MTVGAPGSGCVLVADTLGLNTDTVKLTVKTLLNRLVTQKSKSPTNSLPTPALCPCQTRPTHRLYVRDVSTRGRNKVVSRLLTYIQQTSSLRRLARSVQRGSGIFHESNNGTSPRGGYSAHRPMNSPNAPRRRDAVLPEELAQLRAERFVVL